MRILFPLAMVHKIPRNKSNHSTMIIKLNNDNVKPTKDFRSELLWKNEDDILDRVMKAWLHPVIGKDKLSCFLVKIE
jgi:hypothetical protein